jgi:methionine biosynthesis protein MetW
MGLIMKNPAFSDVGDAYYNQEKEFLLHLIPDGPNKVLDVGCGSGGVGRKLLNSGKAAEMVGIEIFEAAAEKARKHYRTVHVGDVESMDLAAYRKYFDVIICGDVLEHLREPSAVLQDLHRCLRDDGLIVCCVPNVRYWRVWKDLVFQGKWEYASEGVMDQTHLRFFTTRSFKKLLIDTSFTIQDEEMQIAQGPKQRSFNKITGGVFQEFLGSQMLITARKGRLAVQP